MKKSILFLLFFVFCLNAKVPNDCIAKSEKSTYAKILGDCKLYSDRSLYSDSVLFILPESYFVAILETLNDCYKVQYKKYVGYVKSSSVLIVGFIPENKFLSGVTIDIKPAAGTQIWSLPSAKSNVLTTISAGVKNIEYVASVYGEIPRGGDCNVWYFVVFTPPESSTDVYEGYVYSENIVSPPNIVYNKEIDISGAELVQSENKIIPSSIKTIIVALISVPIILFILLILYKIVIKYRKYTDKDQKQKYNQIENSSENLTFNHEESNALKEEIKSLQNKEFTRKKSAGIPSFPDYASDDDWL